MSSLEQRLKAFAQLPLRAQAAFIAASRSSPLLAQNADYLAQLEQIHQDCLRAASAEQREAYDRAIGLL